MIYTAVALALLPLISAQRQFDIDCSLGSDVCGQQTAAAAKCLTPCFNEAQGCFRQVGTVISRIQQCMLDLDPSERQASCNTCINTQLENHCDEYFRQFEEQCGAGVDESEDDNDKFYFRTFGAYDKFCNRLGSRDECKEMGCQFTTRGGCGAKLNKEGQPKLKCKRIRNRSMCNSVRGCSLRKKNKVKDSGKKKICKGDAVFPDGL